MPLIAALVAALGEWAINLLVGLGFSLVSYKFTSTALDYLLDRISSSYFSFDNDLVGLLGLAGIPESFNIIFGAFNFCVGIFSASRSVKFFGKNK